VVYRLPGACVRLKVRENWSQCGLSDQYAKFAQRLFAGHEKGDPGACLFEKLFFLTEDTCTGNE
jgi:hypothetical protein